MRAFAFVLALVSIGAMPVQLDSERVLDAYATALANLVPPKAMIFVYTVSQAGPANIEERHRIYRSGMLVRDETLAVNGAALRRKGVRVRRRPDPYTAAALAPRPGSYEMLFVDAVPDGDHFDYVFETQPYMHAPAGFAVDRVTVDGANFLPRVIEFHSSGALASGTGRIVFGSVAGHWVPLLASVNGVSGGGMARERIVFGEYRFPPALPRSTFL